jgi:hypothetical protein
MQFIIIVIWYSPCLGEPLLPPVPQLLVHLRYRIEVHRCLIVIAFLQVLLLLSKLNYNKASCYIQSSKFTIR